VLDIAAWAVPFGIVGGRLYHVATSGQPYFGPGGHPIEALYIWQGGLGIWGAVVLGGVGAWIACRRHGVKLPPYGDAIAPGILVAQAIGRWGNWFNNELYGRGTSQPWGLKIYEWDSSAGKAVVDAAGHPKVLGIYQPTFLYESIWDLVAAALLVLADRRWKLGHGRVFALYVVLYSAGRGVIETLRIDEANHILGLRLNVWTSIVVFIGGLTYLIVSAALRPGRETDLLRPDVAGEAGSTIESDASDEADDSDESGSTSSKGRSRRNKRSGKDKSADKDKTDDGQPGDGARGSKDESASHTAAG
jgi:prolipoprotein diacylglyceryl transferase